MSVNEPGSTRPGGPRNPWDRKPPAGPPDLDAVIRRVVKQIKDWWNHSAGAAGGPGEGGAGSSAGPKFSINWMALAITLLSLWGSTGFYQVGAAERVIITRFGRFLSVSQPGGVQWHWPWPIEAKQVINTQELLSHPEHTTMLTRDEALVDINVAVQYRRSDPYAFVFKVVDPEQALYYASESAIREIIGQSDLEYVLERGRQDIAIRTKQLIQRTLDSYSTGLEVMSVNLQDVGVPEQVAPSQKDAIKAREDKDRARVEAQTYANDILPKARGTASQELLNAEAYKTQSVAKAEGESSRFTALLSAYQRAPQVTRERLYLETVESVFKRSSKVIVDAKSNGNMLYLPLDKLMENKAAPVATKAPAPAPLPEITVTAPPEPVADGRARATR